MSFFAEWVTYDGHQSISAEHCIPAMTLVIFIASSKMTGYNEMYMLTAQYQGERTMGVNHHEKEVGIILLSPRYLDQGIAISLH